MISSADTRTPRQRPQPHSHLTLGTRQLRLRPSIPVVPLTRCRGEALPEHNVARLRLPSLLQLQDRDLHPFVGEIGPVPDEAFGRRAWPAEWFSVVAADARAAFGAVALELSDHTNTPSAVASCSGTAFRSGGNGETTARRQLTSPPPLPPV